MFDRIASVYDLMNSTMTAGLHHRWRARAADLARLRGGGRALDVATGTGDLAFELAARTGDDGLVVGVDFSEGMLARARAKARGREHRGSVRFEWADAASLPFPDHAFDAVTVGFGARNFEDFPRCLSEMVRVLRPGGRVVILEITTPRRPPLSSFHRLWFDRAVPQLGRLAAAAQSLSLRAEQIDGEGVAAAYTYLPSSVKRWYSPQALAAEMERASLSQIAWITTAGGIVAIHSATVVE
jgi:demethylmenaquinone methyltransferase/2-methoxy-6-polyprenyl-1,4-benzoquinol methylase